MLFWQGVYSSKSDVWSFAVTLWEILTLARERPLSYLTDEQVMENCSLLYYGNQQPVILSQPSNCPKEIYDLMVECWNMDESLRPTFNEIHMFLHHKNMGFQPVDWLIFQLVQNIKFYQAFRCFFSKSIGLNALKILSRRTLWQDNELILRSENI